VGVKVVAVFGWGMRSGVISLEGAVYLEKSRVGVGKE